MFAAGTLIDGKFEVVKTLGTGGYGEVFLARQQGFDRMVALKILRTTCCDAESDARFFREAKLLSMLSHPNIATFLGYGVGDEIRYTVLEYIDGETLSERISTRGSLSLEETVAIAKQIASALIHAHARGIIHRDLKPANVIFAKGLPGQPAKLIDFGLAHVQTAEDQRLTQAGLALGTAVYMSPEQCLGEELDARTDLYSLGCILYQCLSGLPPYLADDSAAIMFKHVNEPLPPCAAAQGTEFEEILSTLLAKERERRYQSAAELLAALDKCDVRNSAPLIRRGKSTKSAPNKKQAIMLGLIIAASTVGGAAMYTATKSRDAAELHARAVPFEPWGPSAAKIRETFSMPHNNRRFDQVLQLSTVAEKIEHDPKLAEALCASEYPYMKGAAMEDIMVRFANQYTGAALACNHFERAKSLSDETTDYLRARAEKLKTRGAYFDLSCSLGLRQAIGKFSGDKTLQLNASRDSYDYCQLAHPDFWSSMRDSAAMHYIDALVAVGDLERARKICTDTLRDIKQLPPSGEEGVTWNPPSYWETRLKEIERALKEGSKNR